MIFRAARFIGVGGAATLAYWLAMVALVGLFHLSPIVSSVIAYLVGFATAFVGHRTFTYKSKAAMRREFGRFLVIYLLCFCVGNFVFWIAVSRFGWNYLVGAALLTGCNVLLSYLAAELWIFERPPSNAEL